MVRPLFRFAACAATALFLSAPAALADTFTVGYEAPGVQTPNGTNHYEQFNGAPAAGVFLSDFNNSGIHGTYSSSWAGGSVLGGPVLAAGASFYAADLYGGAGGSGQYLVTQYLTDTTLRLDTQVRYFGLWFSALDSGNILNFYENGALVYSFTAPDYVDGVGDCPGSAYCGNPNANMLDLDPLEQFAYVNLVDVTGTFNSVEFKQVTGEHYGRFEADNNAVAVYAPGTTPEPSSLILLGTGLVGLAGAVRRRVR